MGSSIKIVSGSNVKKFLKDGGLKITPVYPISKWNHWELLQSVTIKLKCGRVITIPKGFQFDGSSTPRGLWWLLPSYGDFLFAALIHDWLYKTDYFDWFFNERTAQKMADIEMLYFSEILNNDTFGKRFDNKARYRGVRLFGRSVYKKKE